MKIKIAKFNIMLTYVKSCHVMLSNAVLLKQYQLYSGCIKVTGLMIISLLYVSVSASKREHRDVIRASVKLDQSAKASFTVSIVVCFVACISLFLA